MLTLLSLVFVMIRVHVDPCEAAVNEPLLYESWGKKQTYIIAIGRDHIDDVTTSYTANSSASM